MRDAVFCLASSLKGQTSRFHTRRKERRVQRAGSLECEKKTQSNPAALIQPLPSQTLPVKLADLVFSFLQLAEPPLACSLAASLLSLVGRAGLRFCALLFQVFEVHMRLCVPILSTCFERMNLCRFAGRNLTSGEPDHRRFFAPRSSSCPGLAKVPTLKTHQTARGRLLNGFLSQEEDSELDSTPGSELSGAFRGLRLLRRSRQGVSERACFLPPPFVRPTFRVVEWRPSSPWSPSQGPSCTCSSCSAPSSPSAWGLPC